MTSIHIQKLLPVLLFFTLTGCDDQTEWTGIKCGGHHLLLSYDDERKLSGKLLQVTAHRLSEYEYRTERDIKRENLKAHFTPEKIYWNYTNTMRWSIDRHSLIQYNSQCTSIIYGDPNEDVKWMEEYNKCMDRIPENNRASCEELDPMGCWWAGWWQLVETRTCELMTEEQLIQSRITFNNRWIDEKIKDLDKVKI